MVKNFLISDSIPQYKWILKRENSKILGFDVEKSNFTRIREYIC